jgi:hypothetical protein
MCAGATGATGVALMRVSKRLEGIWSLRYRVVKNKEKPRPFRSRLGKIEDSEGLVVFRDACEDSAGRRWAPIAIAKSSGVDTVRHAE